MTPWQIHVAVYKSKSEIVVIAAEDIEIDQSISRPVIVSANLSGSEPDWTIIEPSSW